MWCKAQESHDDNRLSFRRLYRAQLTRDQLSALLAYKNHGVDLSLTYRFILSHLYDRLIHYIPLWVAPNLVTLFGFVLAFLGHLAVVLHAPTFTEAIPQWASFSAAIGLLSYMILDNLDGRQARRTRSSSPLGHLFDHGCDALNVTLSGMAIAATLHLGPQYGTCLVILGQITLFTATLEELFTGAMVLREINGPNEGIISIVGMQLAAAVCGTSFWERQVVMPWPFTSHLTTTGRVAAVVGGLVGIVTALQSLMAIVQHIGLRKSFARGAPRVAGFGAYITAYAVWALYEPHVYQSAMRNALWTSGFFVFDLVSRMILVHLTGTAPFPFAPALLSCVLMPPALALVAQKYSVLSYVANFSVPLAVGVASTGAIWRAVCIVEQLCEFLNVNCLRLGPRHNKITPGDEVMEVRRAHGMVRKADDMQG